MLIVEITQLHVVKTKDKHYEAVYINAVIKVQSLVSVSDCLTIYVHIEIIAKKEIGQRSSNYITDLAKATALWTS